MKPTTSRGCMYTTQGTLLCGKPLEHYEDAPQVQDDYRTYFDDENNQTAYQENYYNAARNVHSRSIVHAAISQQQKKK